MRVLLPLRLPRQTAFRTGCPVGRPWFLLYTGVLLHCDARSDRPHRTAGARRDAGPGAEPPDDIFASFIGSSEIFTDDGRLILFPAITDPTGNITETDLMHVQLAPGYYLVSYSVSALFNVPSYMQITPYYNGQSHIETGVYFATRANGSSACGSAHFILYAPAATPFTLTYSGPIDARDGTVTLTFLKLRRPL